MHDAGASRFEETSPPPSIGVEPYLEVAGSRMDSDPICQEQQDPSPFH
jgi:hypothetical protein